MKHNITSLLICLALICSFTGCAAADPADTGTAPSVTDTDIVFTAPPALTLSAEGSSFPIDLGTHSWNYDKGDGTWAGICCDHAHPLDCEEFAQPIVVSDGNAVLVFESAPDSFTIRCWPDSAWGNSLAESEPVTADGFAFTLKPGGYIYEVIAQWNKDVSPYHGSAYYFFYAIAGENHIHQAAQQAQTVDDPVSGYCGNTVTTLFVDDQTYTFMGSNSVALTDILINLNYDAEKLCRCINEYKADTEFGTGYGINLTHGFARCDKGQADLTQAQIDTIAGIIEWAKMEQPSL